MLPLCAQLLGANQASRPDDRPNVVLILIDDLSHYGVTAYGADRIGSFREAFEVQKFSTPRIDRLAEQGVLCNRAYTYPLCESTRIALMSGQNNNRNYLDCKAQHESDITFGDIFKRAGYATGIFGKWKQSRGTPDTHAKDYIFKFGWDEFTCFDVVGERQRFINPNLVINGTINNFEGRTDKDPATGRRWYGPDICNRHALDFIERHKDVPFFVYYPMMLVHDDHKPTPDTRPKRIFDTFDEVNHNRDGHTGDDHKYFPDMIAYTDKLIGKVVDKIDELNLTEKTLIIVMGDNGTKEVFFHVLPDGTVYPARKGGNTDNGIHVPLLLRQPGTIPSGNDGKMRRYDGLVHLTDIFPTIAEAAGVDVPNPDSIDGISFWKQATGAPGEPRKMIHGWYTGNNPYTAKDVLLEYAFDKNFKRYAPDKDFPNGRFFDLRTDLLEREGSHFKEYKFKVRRYSGLQMDKLTKEQQDGYKRLGAYLDEMQMVHVEALKIQEGIARLKAGEQHQLACQIIPEAATRRNVIWESSDPDVLSVDKFGVMTAHKPGKVTIRVFSWDDARPMAKNLKQAYFRTGIQDRLEVQVR